jgi:hypothetical protein
VFTIGSIGWVDGDVVDEAGGSIGLVGSRNSALLELLGSMSIPETRSGFLDLVPTINRNSNQQEITQKTSKRKQNKA